MPSFLTIPRELRNQICMYILFGHTNERPALDRSFEELVEFRCVYNKPSLQSWNRLVLGPAESTTSNAATLLLVNHQLYAEARENIKLFAQSATYDLDVILLDEILLLPTWTHVPFLTTNLQEVNATFRISGSYDWDKDKRKKGEEGSYARFGRYKGFRIGNGAGPAMSWQIYSVLERFIRVGPTGEREHTNEHRHVTVKTLNINVETPSGIDPSRFGVSRSAGRIRAGSSEEGDVLEPKYLASFIRNQLTGLLSGGDREWFAYGQILFEHVDDIVIRKDGEEMHRFDIAQMLRDLGGFQERHLTLQDLREYKEKAWLVRKERGLKVLAE